MADRFRIQDFDCTRHDGLTIRGALHLPASGSGPFPVAIIGHSFGSTWRQYRRYAEYLAEHGIVGLAFDFCGGGRHTSSDGQLRDMSVYTEVDDVHAVLNAVMASSYADPQQIYLIGASQGGYVSGIVASTRSDDVAGLVMMYPALCIPKDCRRDYPTLEDVPDIPRLFNVPVGPKYFYDAWDLNPDHDFQGYNGPWLIIHGDHDEVAPVADSYRASSIYPNASLVVIPGAGHGFRGDQMDQANQQIVEFIQRCQQ